MTFLSRLRTLKLLFPVLSILTLSACAKVEINDHEWCTDMGSQGATCFHTMTTQTRDIPKSEWDDLRFGNTCTADPQSNPGATMADMKSVIERLCIISKRCNYQTQQAIRDFFYRVDQAQPDLFLSQHVP